MHLITQFPWRLVIGNFKIPLHFILQDSGIFIAIRYYVILKKRTTDIIDKENRFAIFVFATVGAVVGAHLLGALETPKTFFQSAQKLEELTGNATILGGLVGGVLFVEVYKLFLGIKTGTGDLFLKPLILGMSIGRVGCFLTGVAEQTYGVKTSLLWGMNLGDGVPRHPVALYEIVFLILVGGLIHRFKSHLSQLDGDLFKWFMVFYLIFRFLLDFIKPGDRYFLGLGTIQITALIGLIYYFFFIFRFYKKSKCR